MSISDVAAETSGKADGVTSVGVAARTAVCVGKCAYG